MLSSVDYALPVLSLPPHCSSFFFFFNDTATTEIYTLSLHDALPISQSPPRAAMGQPSSTMQRTASMQPRAASSRSEEHTSELQSPDHLVCRLLLEKKKTVQHAEVKHCQHVGQLEGLHQRAAHDARIH